MTQYYIVDVDPHNEWRAKQERFNGIRFSHLTSAVQSTNVGLCKASDGTDAMSVKSLHAQGVQAIVPLRFLRTESKHGAWLRFIVVSMGNGDKEIRIPKEMVTAQGVPFLQLSCGQSGYHCVLVRREWILTRKEE